MNDHALPPEDYAEPRCLLCDEPYGAAPEVRSVPQRRIADKLDEYMSRRDYLSAERHLLYWLEEARLGHDLRGELFLCNELIGHYRKTADRDKALPHIERALALLDELDYGGTVSAGTTLVNAATACNAFGEDERALSLFERSRAAYESAPDVRPELLGGLYNNMAVVCQSLGRFSEAFALYDRAMETMARVPGGALEQAVTCLNRADAIAAAEGMEAGEGRINELLERAYALLHYADAPRNGYYAFVCEKCAPGFAYYGWFAAAAELKETAEEIYERA